VQPFRWPDGRTAAVEVRHSLGQVQRDFAAEIRERIAARLVILVFFVLAIVAITRWSIARPIQALIRTARAVGGGDLTQRIEVRRADELGVLAVEFNRMAGDPPASAPALLEQSEERLRLEREVQQTQSWRRSACWPPRSPTRSAPPSTSWRGAPRRWSAPSPGTIRSAATST
jgi:HAMP domain-containing protein